jgi:hypothetical protein
MEGRRHEARGRSAERRKDDGRGRRKRTGRWITRSENIAFYAFPVLHFSGK